MKYIPRGLAFDILFGSNSYDSHKAIDMIYDGWESKIGACETCIYSREQEVITPVNLKSKKENERLLCSIHLQNPKDNNWYCADYKPKDNQ